MKVVFGMSMIISATSLFWFLQYKQMMLVESNAEKTIV